MIDQTSTLISSAAFLLIGGGAIGFGVGYLLKKLIKLAFITLGLIALLLGYLEYQKWISVNWVTVENQTSTIMAHAAHKAYVITQQMGHEIPISLGVIGFMPGFFWGLHVVRGRYDMTSKFTQKILDWTKLHPDDPSGAFILENYRDGRRNRKNGD